MTDQDQEKIRERLAALFLKAGLSIDAAAMDRVAALVAENEASGARVRKMVARYQEPAFGLPARRRG